MTNPPPVERRRLRSRITDHALGHWLAAVAARAGLSAIVVADEDGLVVGGGGAGESWDELAALAAGASLDAGGAGRFSLRGAPGTVRAMSFQGYPLRLCTLGDSATAGAALDEARAGIERILAAAP